MCVAEGRHLRSPPDSLGLLPFSLSVSLSFSFSRFNIYKCKCSSFIISDEIFLILYFAFHSVSKSEMKVNGAAINDVMMGRREGRGPEKERAGDGKGERTPPPSLLRLLRPRFSFPTLPSSFLTVFLDVSLRVKWSNWKIDHPFKYWLDAKLMHFGLQREKKGEGGREAFRFEEVTRGSPSLAPVTDFEWQDVGKRVRREGGREGSSPVDWRLEIAIRYLNI